MVIGIIGALGALCFVLQTDFRLDLPVSIVKIAGLARSVNGDGFDCAVDVIGVTYGAFSTIPLN